MDLCWDELGHLESAFLLCGATVAFDAVRYWSRKYRQINFCLHTHTHIHTAPTSGALKLKFDKDSL